MPTYEYDVFLSYNSEDMEQVQQIAGELRELGIKVWFDKWEIRPGETWDERLYQGISESRSVIAFVGSAGIGSWQTVEVKDALQKHVKQKKTVIPVLLPGAESRPELPPFLGQLQWIEYNNSKILPIKLTQLILGITGRALEQSISQTGEEFKLKLQAPFKKERYIEIYTLPNPHPDKLLDVAWETFGKGIEKLRDQIRNYGFRVSVDASFGVNDAGLVMAAFLNSSVLDRGKIGYIRYKGFKEGQIVTDENSFFPELDQAPTIMLVDFEVKSGNNLKIAVNRIREKYPKARIYFSVFGALTEKDDLKINSFEELKAAEKIKTLGIEDMYISCIMNNPGIEPPLWLR